MKFRNLLVSEDNQLVLSDYGLNEGEAEILDLNKSLHDVAQDQELRSFIVDNAVDPQKIYIFCVKEDFGNNDQLLEDIPDIKAIGKAIKKAFKKLPNIYFFVYNTYLKSEDAINPTLGGVEAVETVSEVPEVSASANQDTTSNEAVASEAANIESEVSVANEDLPLQDDVIPEEPVVANEDLPLQDEAEAVPEEPVEISNEDLPFIDEVVEMESPDAFDDSVTNFVTNQSVSTPEFIEDERAIAQEVLEDAIDNDQAKVEYSDEELPVVEHEFEGPSSEAPVNEISQRDFSELNQIVDEDIRELGSHDDSPIVEDITDSNEIAVEPTEDVVLFNEPEMLSDEELPITESISDSVEEVGLETNVEENTKPADETKKDDESGIEMPTTFFDTEKEEEISYEDYNEFVNDYELNIHALKSIYDFIWRILVLNNYNLKLNDLLYIAVNNLDAFSIGQSDFVRQTANKAESLFDLILQLDIKLEFNNSLFYIYLAEFFKISGNKIIVNEKFLDTISIWVNKASKEKFIAQIEQFMNYSTIYNKKIVFSYFIELANYVKGRLPSINSDISLIDVHRLLNNKYNKIRKENIFGFMVEKINQILEANGVVIEMYLVKTPDSMFGIEINQPSSQTDSWKSQLALLYKKLIENIQSYILLKGNKENEIFNIFMDIRDLRMYQDAVQNKNVLSPETISILNKPDLPGYLTIGDEMNREEAIVPSQKEDLQYSYVKPESYLEGLEKGNYMERKFGTDKDNIVNNSQENLAYPQKISFEEKYASKFNVAEFESSISRRIEEYERKIRSNISRIETERKQLREKMEELKNL